MLHRVVFRFGYVTDTRSATIWQTIQEMDTKLPYRNFLSSKLSDGWRWHPERGSFPLTVSPNPLATVAHLLWIRPCYCPHRHQTINQASTALFAQGAG